MSVSYGGDSITFADGSIVASGSQGFKNKFINGAMTIDQRASGNLAYANTGTSAFVTVDRVAYNNASGANLTLQQSTTSGGAAAAGFTKSLKLTVTVANASLTSGQFTRFYSGFEGLNMADLAWGTADAKPITLSFWVRSSVVGLHSIVIQGYLVTTISAYAGTYTINSADTWEYKTITIPGCTTGTWATDNSQWGYMTIGHGSGSTGLATANTWNTGLSGYVNQASGTVSVLGTVGATWYITGLQVEKGSTASSFEFRSIQKELMLCQRYLPYWKFDSSSNQIFTNSHVMSTTNSGVFPLVSPVPTRIPPTGVTVSSASHFAASEGDSGITFSGLTFHSASYTGMALNWSSGSTKTAFRPILVYNVSSSAYIYGTGCEL
jgi:hypothetical protein